MNIIDLDFKLKGRFKLTANKIDEDGNIISSRPLTDWFDNLITDLGLENICGSADVTYNNVGQCVVGSGNATPLVSDTQLQSFVAKTATVQSAWAYTAQITTAPYYVSGLITMRFATGVAAGNLSEIGFTSHYNNSGTGANAPLWCRALILDGAGNPTTITVLSDEVLDVTYELRVYLPNNGNDITGSFSQTIDGTLTTFNYTMRASNVAGIVPNSAWSNEAITGTQGPKVTVNFCGVSNLPLQSITSSGSTSYFDGGTDNAYIAGSKQRDSSLTMSLNTGNITWSLYRIRWIGFGEFQMYITPSITKVNTKVYTLNVRASWGRYP